MGWGTIISFAIKIILKVIGYVEKRNGEVIEAKKMFYEFIDHVDTDIPIKLNRSHKRQLVEVKKELELKKKRRKLDAEELEKLRKS